MGLWSDLTNLEAIETGPGWRVSISSQREEFSPATRWPEFAQVKAVRSSSVDDGGVGLEHVDIVVDEHPVEYRGLSILGVWHGAPIRGDAPIVELEGLPPEAIALATISDPSDHLSRSTRPAT